VPVVEVPLQDSMAGFACDFEGVLNAAIANAARLVFLCSPGNPTGNALPLERVRSLAERLRGQAVVVVDEAYLEYAGTASAAGLLASLDNIAVLRTLSKAHALAAARIGSVIATPELIEVLQRCQAPYPIATPCAEVALAALSPEACRDTDGHVARVLLERQRLTSALQAAPGVVQVYPSSSNFLLVRLVDAEASWQALLSAGVVVRDVRAHPGLENALRISIGTPEENDRVLAVLATTASGVPA
jgi:histidinol-phosphate aminotransferase